MKIGIITFHRTKNYGGILQTYALLKCVKDLGFEAEIVDYWPTYRQEFHAKLHRDFWNIGFIKKLRALIRYTIKYKRNKTRNQKTNSFIYEHFGSNVKPKYNRGDIIKEEYDICIYGSDQIWRKYNLKSFKGFDETYFGKYPLNCAKKITYAASMGQIDVNKNDKETVKNLLSNFNSLAVREQELQDFLKNEFDIDSSLVCDPTFLISKDKWLKIIANDDNEIKRPCKRSYVLYYNITKSDLGYKIANELSKKHNLKIIEIPQPPMKHITGPKKAGTAGPSEFLNYICFADYVVSSSFHGVAFSVIFEKQFYAVGMKKNSSRAITALSRLNLENRFIKSITQFNESTPINYKMINSSLLQYRKESISYLRKNLKE